MCSSTSWPDAAIAIVLILALTALGIAYLAWRD